MNKPTEAQVWDNDKIADRLLTLVESGMDVDSAAGKLVRELRDEMQARIMELTAENARLVSEAGEWRPLRDGEYVHDSIIDGRIKLRIDDDGESIAIIGPEEGDWESINLSPFRSRLCLLVRRTTTEDTAPCVPVDVLEALQTLTYLAIEMADEVWIYHDATEMHALDSGVRRAGKIVREWLDAQKERDNG